MHRNAPRSPVMRDPSDEASIGRHELAANLECVAVRVIARVLPLHSEGRRVAGSLDDPMLHPSGGDLEAAPRAVAWAIQARDAHAVLVAEIDALGRSDAALSMRVVLELSNRR